MQAEMPPKETVSRFIKNILVIPSCCVIICLVLLDAARGYFFDLITILCGNNLLIEELQKLN